MIETYSTWKPIPEIESEMFVDAVIDDCSGLRILLRSRDPLSPVICICFENYYVYRNADESYRLLLWSDGVFENKSWPLCKTSQSNLIDWLDNEEGGVYAKNKMIHYLIKTDVDVIDIVTNQTPPKVWVLNKDEKKDWEGKISNITFG